MCVCANGKLGACLVLVFGPRLRIDDGLTPSRWAFFWEIDCKPGTRVFSGKLEQSFPGDRLLSVHAADDVILSTITDYGESWASLL